MILVVQMLDPNLGRTCRIEALGNIWICSFLSDCRVNWTQVAPSWSSAEAFWDLLKLFRRGTDGVYLFRMPMQAMASHASGSRITVLLIVVIYTGHFRNFLILTVNNITVLLIVVIYTGHFRNFLILTVRAVLMGTKSCTKILILPKIFPTRFRFTFYG